MSDMISYKVSFSPSPVTIGVSVTVVSDKIKATVTSVPDVGLSLTPSGNFVQKVLSAIVLPIADLIVKAVNPKPRNMLQDHVVTTVGIPNYPVDTVTISANTLALGDATLAGVQYLKATAKLALAATPSSGSTS